MTVEDNKTEDEKVPSPASKKEVKVARYQREKDMLSFHQANIWFNECYADYCARRGSGSLVSVPKVSTGKLNGTGTAKNVEITPNEGLKKDGSLLDVFGNEMMHMLCGLMKENAELKQKELATSTSPSEFDIDDECVVVGPDEVMRKADITFASTLIVEGKILGSVRCIPTDSSSGGYSLEAENGDEGNAVSPSIGKNSKGNKTYRGSVIVEETGVLNANIKGMKKVTVKGRLIGKIDCEQLSVGPSAQVVGKIKAHSLAIKEGATIVGNITSGRASSKNFSAEHRNGEQASSNDDAATLEFVSKVEKLMEKENFRHEDFEEVQRLYNKMTER